MVPDGLDVADPAGGRAPQRRHRQPAGRPFDPRCWPAPIARFAPHPATHRRARTATPAAHHPQLQLPQPSRRTARAGPASATPPASSIRCSRRASRWPCWAPSPWPIACRVALRDGPRGRSRAHGRALGRMEIGYRSFAALIHRFYHARPGRERSSSPSPESSPLRAAITSLLGGDLWRADNPFQQMLLSSTPREAWHDRAT